MFGFTAAKSDVAIDAAVSGTFLSQKRLKIDRKDVLINNAVLIHSCDQCRYYSLVWIVVLAKYVRTQSHNSI